jgi:hypothetical protein
VQHFAAAQEVQITRREAALRAARATSLGMPAMESVMWKRYRKTLVGTQVSIALVTLAALIWSQRFYVAAGFFIAMQLGAVFGAMWAVRLERLFLHRNATSPERRC